MKHLSCRELPPGPDSCLFCALCMLDIVLDLGDKRAIDGDMYTAKELK